MVKDWKLEIKGNGKSEIRGSHWSKYKSNNRITWIISEPYSKNLIWCLIFTLEND